MKPLTFTYNTSYQFEISATVLTIMRGFVQNEPAMPEAGGVLLGRHLLGSRDIVVDELTTPMKGDKQTRYFFFRAQRSHQKVIDRRWHASAGTCNYLGEWHTHPEPSPRPSGQDLQNWRAKLRYDVVDHDALYFVIAGQREIAAWCGCRRTLEITKLTARRERSVWDPPIDLGRP